MPDPIVMPPSIARLPLDPVRKVPVPWFVKWIEGRPEFRAMDGRKILMAYVDKLCWVCGERLDNRCTFLIGPMCVVNRISSEPASHPACAEYSVRACPFLSRPSMVRREGPTHGGEMLDGPEHAAGVMITRNPGVTCLWTARPPGAMLVPDPHANGYLFRMYPPMALSWWREGRRATRAEVLDSVAAGLPALEEMATAQGPEAVAMLATMIEEAAGRWPLG